MKLVYVVFRQQSLQARTVVAYLCNSISYTSISSQEDAASSSFPSHHIHGMLPLIS